MKVIVIGSVVQLRKFVKLANSFKGVHAEVITEAGDELPSPPVVELTIDTNDGSSIASDGTSDTSGSESNAEGVNTEGAETNAGEGESKVTEAPEDKPKTKAKNKLK